VFLLPGSSLLFRTAKIIQNNCSYTSLCVIKQRNFTKLQHLMYLRWKKLCTAVFKPYEQQLFSTFMFLVHTNLSGRETKFNFAGAYSI